MRRNAASALPRRRRCANTMAEFDALPAVLRGWLRSAILPWSPRSARRAWTRIARATEGDPALMLARLDALEASTLAREKPGFSARGDC